MPLDPATSQQTTGTRSAAERLRSVVLAGYRKDPAAVETALDDPDPAVRSMALGALARLGSLLPATLIGALDDPEPEVRRRACELAATWVATSDADAPQNLPTRAAVRARLGDDDTLVVEAACWAVGEYADRTAVEALGTLVVMPNGHRDPRVREAAVGALGAIAGALEPELDPNPVPVRALDAVLAATSDKPAIRRRAAVALSAFDGPEVEAALRRLAGDRDWQVRQVIEELVPREPPSG